MGQNEIKEPIHKSQADNFETPLAAVSVVSTVQVQALLLIASFKHARRLQLASRKMSSRVIKSIFIGRGKNIKTLDCV